MAKADDLKAKLGMDGTPLQHIQTTPPNIPDHATVRCIGQGSYGEVWLARNAVGTWRAIKVVHRNRFKDARPYEREFSGIQKYEPISRSNEGLVDVLQIGRNDEEGYFYYVMELADDAVGGDQTMEAYVPKTLAREIQNRGRLSVEECITLGLTLNLALGHLHRSGLIHRDIKPSNIIFVNGVPKLADIGLVTELAGAQSFVGTEGFIPPEGPNSPQADLYALGKVLYEASMGKDRQEFPEPRSGLGMDAESKALMELNAVLLRACAPKPTHRYQSAEEMNADLALLHSGRSVKDRHALERRLKIMKRVAMATVAVMVLGVVPYYLAITEARRARAQAAKSQQVAKFLSDMLEGVGPAVARGRDTVMLREILDKTAERIGNELKDQPAEQVELMLIMARTYSDLSQHTNALNLTEKALRLRKSLFDKDHPAVAEALHHYGLALMQLGRLSESQSALEEALALRTELPGVNPLDTANTLHALGDLFMDRNDLTKAEEMLRQALAIRIRLLGEQHEGVAKSMGTLATLLTEKGDLPGAEKAFRETLSLQRKLLNVDEVDVTKTLNNFSVVLRQRGDLSGAEDALQEVLRTRVRLLSTNHTLVASAFMNLANAQFMRGNLPEAEADFRQALDIYKTLLPHNHPSVAQSMANLANVLEEKGDPDASGRNACPTIGMNRPDQVAEWKQKLAEFEKTLANKKDAVSQP